MLIFSFNINSFYFLVYKRVYAGFKVSHDKSHDGVHVQCTSCFVLRDSDTSEIKVNKLCLFCCNKV